MIDMQVREDHQIDRFDPTGLQMVYGFLPERPFRRFQILASCIHKDDIVWTAVLVLYQKNGIPIANIAKEDFQHTDFPGRRAVMCCSRRGVTS